MGASSVVRAILRTIEAILAVIGGLVVAGLAYLWFADPLNLRPLLRPGPAADTAAAQDSPAAQPTSAAPASAAAPSAKPTPAAAPAPTLTPQQQAAAASLGLDQNSLAAMLTPEVEACAVASLGQERVNQIKAGAAPSPLDLLQAGHCLNR